jgi:SSS family solute:Na+ symporter
MTMDTSSPNTPFFDFVIQEGMSSYEAALQINLIQNGYPAGGLLWIVNNIYFQYFSVLITVVSAIVMVVVSHMSAEPDYTTLKGLTFSTATAEDDRKTRASWSATEVMASAFVMVCILGGYLYFRG